MTDLFDPETGEIHDPRDGCPDCRRAALAHAEMERDLQRVERELRLERREVARLKTELTKQRTQSAEGRVARAIFDYWVARCEKNPKRAVFGEKRQKCVIARLHEHSPEYIARAIDGLASSSWHRENGQDDLELVCRDEVKLEGFYERAERAKAPTLIGPAWVREFGSANVAALDAPMGQKLS